MASIATGFGRAQLSRAVRDSRRHRRGTPGPYVAPHEYVPAGTADLWRSARRYAR